MRKKGWEDSSNNPDWTDCESMMRALSALHSGHAGVSIIPLGTGFGTGLSVAAQMAFEVLPGSALPQMVTVAKDWPCAAHKTLVAHIFSLLYELDYAIGKVYKNEQLWK